MKETTRWYLNLLFSWKSVYVFECSDISFSPEFLVKERFMFSKLQERDISELIKFHDTYCIDWNFLFSAEDVKNRLRDGHSCYIAREDGKLVGFLWFAVNKLYSPDLRCTFYLKDHCVALYNAFARAKHRGVTVMPGILRMGYQELAKEGYEKGCNYIRPENRAALKVSRRFNFFPIGKIIYGYFLGYYFFFSFIKRDVGITAHLSESPWHRWKGFFRKRFGR